MIIERRVLLPAGTPLSVFPLFVLSPSLDIPEGTRSLTFFITYVGADRPIFRVFYGDQFVASLAPSDDGRDTIVEGGSLSLTPPDAQFDFWLSQPRGPSTASGITYILNCNCIPGGIRRVTLEVADATVAGSTIEVTVTGDG